MTAGTDQLKEAFRDFQTSGVPATGPNEPDKVEIRAALDSVGLDILAAAGASSGTAVADIVAAIDPIRDDALAAAAESEASAAVTIAARDITLGYMDSASASNNGAQIAATQTGADKVATASDRAQTTIDRGYVQTALGQAQAISFATSIDSRKNLVIGTDGAVAPGGAASDGSIAFGVGAGADTLQTYSRKIIAIGFKAGIGFRGYASPLLGAYAGARAVSDFGSAYGTHALQDANMTGAVVEGFGTRAGGSVTFLGVPAVGNTVTLNGIVLTVAASPATAYEFAPGATAAEAASNLLQCLLGLTDAAILNGFYRRDTVGGAAVFIASASRGSYGNGYTLAATGANIAVSGATLTGGSYVVNDGLPGSTEGDNGFGFGAGGNSHHMKPRRASVRAVLGSLPADGATFKLGFNFGKTVTFKTAPAAALDVQIGATIAATLDNITATLNGSADTTIAAATYWGQAGGVLMIEHDSTNVSTFECASQTSALMFDAANLRFAGISATLTAGNNSFGHNTLTQSNVTSALAIGTGSGVSTTGAHRVTIGYNAANLSNGSDWFVASPNGLSYTEGDSVIAIGSNLSGGAIQSYQAIVSMSVDGVITFAAPHGWRQGNTYGCAWRDRTAGGAAIQRAPTGTTTWANVAATLGGVTVIVINAMQVRMLVGLPDADTGGRIYDYRITGTATNIDVARYTRDVTRSVTIGGDATVRPYTITVGSRFYTEGMRIDAKGLNVPDGQVRLPSIIPGAAGAGNILFAQASGNFADGETVTLNGTVFTAKSASSFASPNNSMIRWFRIGADMWESLNNLLACIRNSDDQTATAIAVNKGRFFLNAVAAQGWYLRFQSYVYGGAAFTLATSKAGATVTAPTVGAVGNLPISTSTYPPKDKGLVMLTSSPANNGGPGMARYDSTTDSWTALRSA